MSAPTAAIFVTESAEYDSNRGHVEYSTAANKQLGARGACLHYNRATNQFEAVFGRYDSDSERNGSPMMFRVAVWPKPRRFKTEKGALKAITEYVLA
jgi:hypothetical protein